MVEDGFEQEINQDDVIGKTDYDVFDKELQIVTEKLTSMHARLQRNSSRKPVHLPSGETLIQLSTKRPMLNQDNEVIGL